MILHYCDSAVIMLVQLWDSAITVPWCNRILQCAPWYQLRKRCNTTEQWCIANDVLWKRFFFFFFLFFFIYSSSYKLTIIVGWLAGWLLECHIGECAIVWHIVNVAINTYLTAAPNELNFYCITNRKNTEWIMYHQVAIMVESKNKRIQFSAEFILQLIVTINIF